jgi:hypothetical protein
MPFSIFLNSKDSIDSVDFVTTKRTTKYDPTRISDGLPVNPQFTHISDICMYFKHNYKRIILDYQHGGFMDLKKILGQINEIDQIQLRIARFNNVPEESRTQVFIVNTPIPPSMVPKTSKVHLTMLDAQRTSSM